MFSNNSLRLVLSLWRWRERKKTYFQSWARKMTTRWINNIWVPQPKFDVIFKWSQVVVNRTCPVCAFIKFISALTFFFELMANFWVNWELKLCWASVYIHFLLYSIHFPDEYTKQEGIFVNLQATVKICCFVHRAAILFAVI